MNALSKRLKAKTGFGDVIGSDVTNNILGDMLLTKAVQKEISHDSDNYRGGLLPSKLCEGGYQYLAAPATIVISSRAG